MAIVAGFPAVDNTFAQRDLKSRSVLLADISLLQRTGRNLHCRPARAVTLEGCISEAGGSSYGTMSTCCSKIGSTVIERGLAAGGTGVGASSTNRRGTFAQTHHRLPKAPQRSQHRSEPLKWHKCFGSVQHSLATRPGPSAWPWPCSRPTSTGATRILNPRNCCDDYFPMLKDIIPKCIQTQHGKHDQEITKEARAQGKVIKAGDISRTTRSDKTCTANPRTPSWRSVEEVEAMERLYAV